MENPDYETKSSFIIDIYDLILYVHFVYSLLDKSFWNFDYKFVILYNPFLSKYDLKLKLGNII